MSKDRERLGYFHRLVKQLLCCCKNKSSERTNAEVFAPQEEDDIVENPEKEWPRREKTLNAKCDTHERREEFFKGITAAAVVGKIVLKDVGVEASRRDDNGRRTQADKPEGSAINKSEDDEAETCEDRDPELATLTKCLSFLECPFVWKPDKEGAVLKNGCWIYDDNERNGSHLIEYLTAKEFEFRLVQNNFFRTLCIYLVLAYEKALLGQVASSIADIQQCQMLVSEAESDINCPEGLLVQDGRKDGIYYVLLASVAHIKFLQGSYSSSWNTVGTVKEKFGNLSPVSRAMVHGLHAGVLMEYGYRGNQMALVPIRAALALDPHCWLWSLFLGKVLGRQRRKTQFHMPAGKEELLALQRAAELHPEAECVSHLADIYKHLNAVITHQGYIPSYLPEVLTDQEINSLPHLARELFVKAASKEPNCPYNNARCAKGLLSLPTPFKDMDLAEKYMVRALHLAPNDSLVNHYAAYYYETRKEFEQALDAYRKALCVSGGSLSGGQGGVGNFPAELGFLALQHRLQTGQPEWLGSSTQVGGGGVRGGRYSITRGAGSVGCASRYSPLFQLDIMLTKYKSRSHRVQTLCNKGHYLLMYEKDLHGALRAFSEAIRTDLKSITLKRFWSVFGCSTSQTNSSVNVFHLMKEEIGRALCSLLTPGDPTYLEDLLEFVCESENAANEK